MSASRASGGLLVETPRQMLVRAERSLQRGADPQALLDVAVQYVEKWGRLAEQVEAGEQLDGRASIYTGETYAQARDRWDAYRALLVDHLRSPDGGGS